MEGPDAGDTMERDQVMSGTVFGLGVGPGDPGLVTVKAARLLASVPVVAYPVQGQGSVARDIAAPYLKAGAAEIAINTPMGERGAADPGYERAAAEILAHVEAGRNVAVLCEGDPLFYGSFIHLMAKLPAACPIEVVPGVSSPNACAATLRLPLAAREDVFVALPATLDEARLKAGLMVADKVAILKVGRHLARLRGLLAETGLLPHAHYVERATREAERTVPLALMDPGHEGTYFSMILISREGQPR